MKRRAPAVPSGYMDAWARLFARSPAERAEQAKERQSTRTDLEPVYDIVENFPQGEQVKTRDAIAKTAGVPDAKQGPISAPQSTQSTGVLPMPHSPKRKPGNG